MPEPQTPPLPSSLPVLPLRRTVAFPADPAAARGEPPGVDRVGQQGADHRSHAAARRAEGRRGRAGSRPARIGGHDLYRAADGAQRPRPEHHLRRRGARARAHREQDRHDDRGERRAAARTPREGRRDGGLRTAHPRAGREGRGPRHGRLGRSAADRARHRRSAAPRLPARLDARRHRRREAEHPRRRPAAQEARTRACDAGARGVGARAQGQDRIAGAGRDVGVAAAVLPAAAAQGDPGRARRRREHGPRRPAGEDRRRQPARARPHAGKSRTRPPGPHGQQRRRRVADDSHLPRLGARSAVVDDHRGPARSGGGARRARRRPLRPRQGQGPRCRVPRRPQAQGRHEGADPLLRRPARCGQDLARPVDCAGHAAEVRAHLARRRSRRGRDPWPPPHLHRRLARPHRAGAEAGGLDEPGLHAG